MNENVNSRPFEFTDFKYVNPDADYKERGALLKLVNEFRDCFALKLDKLGCT